MRSHPFDHYWAYQAIIQAVKRIPPPLAYSLARGLASFFFLLLPADRRNLIANLTVVFEGDTARARTTCLKLFKNYGQYLIDYFLLPQLPFEKLKEYYSPQIGEVYLHTALQNGRGALLLTGHLGNWEMGGILLRYLNYPLNIVTLPHNTERANDLIKGLRQEKQIRTIELGGSPLGTLNILAALKRNEVVALLADKVFWGKSAEVAFFGHEVPFPLGPYLVAQASGAAVLPVFMLRDPKGRYQGFIEPPLTMGPATDETTLLGALGQFVRLFEHYIRHYPDQWYNVDRLFPKAESRF
jgi:KDO2-lipid IV(A) lauroyltransferase